MRFFFKTACNFLSFSGNLSSLEDVKDEVNNGDQNVQPQTEKNKRSRKKREYVQDQLIEIHQEHLAMLERSEKRHQGFMERMIQEQNEQDERERERDRTFFLELGKLFTNQN